MVPWKVFKKPKILETNNNNWQNCGPPEASHSVSSTPVLQSSSIVEGRTVALVVQQSLPGSVVVWRSVSKHLQDDPDWRGRPAPVVPSGHLRLSRGRHHRLHQRLEVGSRLLCHHRQVQAGPHRLRQFGTFFNKIFLVSVKRRMDDGGMVGWCDISILILLLFCFIFETWNKEGGKLESVSSLTQRADEMA